MLATITLLADVAKLAHYKDPNWTVLKFGEIKFQSMLSVKSYIQEQASKLLSLCPKSVEIPSAIAEIFSAGLPLIHRNQTLAKDYLEQGLKNFPNSLKLNYRLAIYYVTVEYNYVKAEELFRLAHSLDEEYYPALISLVQILMRKKQRDVTMELIDKALDQSHWDSKQRGGLHFFRGLLLCSDSFSKSKAAADEFVKSFQCHEKSLAFHELPTIHRRYGWPQWDTDTRLSFEKIRQRIKRVELAGIDPERKAIFTKILQEIDMAALADSKLQIQTPSRWKR
jgi:tetratricopeptide (TPR) repeat protein